jgi:DNA polymerase I-like protein with 3'-5' exonuclease and polymerase domains
MVAKRTWMDALDEAGFPRRICVVDYETFFDRSYSLSHTGTWEYICDPRFETQCVGYCDMPGDERVVPGWNYVELKRLNAEDVTWSFQNAAFDASILAIIHSIYPKYFIDTKLLAAHLWPAASHSLKDVAKQLGLPTKGDPMNFMGKRYETMIEQEQNAYINYTANDVRLQYKIGMKLLPLIDNPAIELPLMQRTVELMTKPCIRFDFEKAKAITAGMLADTAHAVEKTGCTERQISGNILFEKLMVEALTEAGDDPKQYFKPVKTGEALALAKDDAERYQLLKHKNERVQLLMEARVAKKSWPLHLKRIERITSLAKCADGLLPVPLNYAGATTGRWSGSYRINLQNLPKRGHDLLLQMREMLAAQAGYKLISADLNAIEARVLSWLAGQDDLTAAFANKVDIYSDFASDFYHIKVWNPTNDDPLPLVKKLKKLRGFGKVCILGMGYGMGATHFSDFAECDYQTAEKAVHFYRHKYPAIPQFWYDLQDAFWAGDVKGKHFTVESGWNGPDSRLIRLPSGRCLRYPKLCGDRDCMSIDWQNGRNHEDVWGGTLVENVVQATARDILGEAILRIESRGFPTCHWIHDEVLIHTREDRAQEAVNVAIEELCRCPTWASDLPLGAEATIKDTYAAE